MVTWNDFAASARELARAGRALITQFQVGLAFLATVRKGGAPRLHPVCPVFSDQHLFVLIVPTSPKCDDLLRDGRYALQSLSGGIGARLGRTLVAQRPGPPMRDLVERGHMTPARVGGADQAQPHGIGLGVGHVHVDLAGGVVLTIALRARTWGELGRGHVVAVHCHDAAGTGNVRASDRGYVAAGTGAMSIMTG